MAFRKTKMLQKSRLSKSSPTRIMGVVNITSDSFSGDGLLAKGLTRRGIIKYAQALVKQGADIIDLGGESSRPGAEPIPLDEELKRVMPVVRELSKRLDVPISVDTYKPEVAKCALDCGASIINDITGLRSQGMIEVIAGSRARVVIMHMKGTPENMQRAPRYKNLLAEIIEYLSRAIKRATDAGINKKRIIIDPGIGFGKTVNHNLQILSRLGELRQLGCPVLVGTSRKSFIGKILGLPVQDRLAGTLASLVAAVLNGADIVRVHDVRFASQAIRIADAVMGSN